MLGKVSASRLGVSLGALTRAYLVII